jgi:RTX calcium-binding nonapeptide repeat (4 copies)
MSITSHPKHHYLATAAVLAAAAALIAPAGASAKPPGVSAELDNGTLHVDGGNRPNAVTLRLKQGDSSRIQVDAGDNNSADFSFARSDVDAISIRMGNGRDHVRIDDSNGSFTDSIPTTIAGGNGDDTLEGGQGIETISGGNGDDFVDGGKGNDRAELGRGDDTFRWDPGEGSDSIEGESGSDTMVFNGASNVPETVTMTANGGRLIFFRQPGSVTMNTDGVETVDFNALGNTDDITVNDLTGTDVTQTNLDLAGALGGNAADGALDTVVVKGTDGNDDIHVTANGSGADVTGLATAVSITHADPDDSLSLNTLPGADSVAVGGVAGVLKVLFNGLPV